MAASEPSRLGWGLALRLARREMRHGFSGFRIFFLCLVLGISTISAVGSLSASMVAGMAAQGQAILGGDMDFRLVHREASEDERAWLDAQGDLSRMATMRAMVRYEQATLLVEAKAVDNIYPLYGELALASGGTLGTALGVFETASGKIYGAVAERDLFDRFGIEPGAVLKLGNIRVRVNDLIIDEPDRSAGGFPLAPRLMLGFEGLRAAGLLQPGSLINFHYRLKLPPEDARARLAAIAQGAEDAFPNAGWRMRDRFDASPSLRRFVERLGLFLTLVGLTALVVGGVGVGNAITAYLERRRETIAIVKALGGSGRFIFKIYALQITLLSVCAIALGLVLGALVPFGVQTLFGAILPVALVPDLYGGPLLAAAGFGLLSAAGFALWPLGKVEKVSVGSLFRQATNAEGVIPARRYLLAIGVCFVGLVALAMVIAERTDIAVWFAVGVALSYLALRATAWLLVQLVRMAGRPRQPEWRLAMSNITRPNAPVRAVVLSMGLSVTLLSTISMLDGNINTQISGDLPDLTPSFFFLDIQPDQIDGFTDLVEATGGIFGIEKSPMLRGQIMAVNGVASVELSPIPDVEWVLRGDRGLTYGRTAPEGGEIVDGAWWADDYQGPPLVSFDAEIAAGLDVGLGDTITVNVLGRPLTATIANLRKIDWASGGLNFFMIFSPEPIARAPHTYLTTVTMTPDKEAELTRAVALAYPNVTIIRVKEALQAASGIIENIGLAVRAMSVVTLLAGILVLAGAMAAGHRARVYDAVVMKVLGATRLRVLTAFMLEYMLMGAGAALIAALAGTVASWALVVGAMQAEWIFLPGTLAATVVGATVLTVVLGLIGTYSALRAPSASVLRTE
ncbi:MAG: FtsX-like permease family protein [Rhizobiales bacterium TMED83]|nr:glycosyl transferase family 1 [Rhodobiaceae bacterium]RPF92698.1 MAG: FtsX-like permease family protein [Rhizobiales bacterium TMED83]